MKQTRLIPCIPTVALLALLLGGGEPCRAAVFNVATVAELQAAFAIATANGEDDTVNIAEGVYQPTSTINYAESENHAIALVGAGPGRTVFDGSLLPLFNSVLWVGASGPHADLTDVLISGLSVVNSAGQAVGVNTSAPLTISDCEIRGNQVGVDIQGFRQIVTVERCLFSGNTGSGLHCTSEGSLVLRNCVFENNSVSSTGYGGGFVGAFDPVVPATIDIVNNTFVGNTAGHGGGISLAMWGNSAVVNIHNNIIRGNTASSGGNDGDDLQVDPQDCPLSLFNNDLGDNADIGTGLSEDLVISNTANYTHGGNITADPVFGIDYFLAAGSPCIDAGNDGAPGLPAVDFEDDPRIVGAHVDIGADERAPLVVHVANVPDLQMALIEAESNGKDDVIHVAPGIYTPTVPWMYLALPHEDSSLTIKGAGDGVTIFDAGGVTSILEIIADAPDPGLHAHVVIEDLSFVNGLTLTADGGAALVALNRNGDITVRRCSFLGNIAGSGGAGAVLAQTAAGEVKVESTIFEGNTALGLSGDGGGLRARSDFGLITVLNSVFFNNIAGYDGGGASLETGEAPVHVVNSNFVGNTAAASDPIGVGGGVKVALFGDNASGMFYNSIFWDNIANGSGDDLFVFADWDGNGVGASVNLAHSLIGANADLILGSGEDLVVTNTDNYASWACLQQDPLLGVDFHLDPASECIDAGDDFAPLLPALDFEGDPRIGGSAVDIGADEVHAQPFFEDGFESGDTTAWSIVVP